jgi:hypothetical protein
MCLSEDRHWAFVGEYSGCSRDSGAVTLYKVEKAPVTKSWFGRYVLYVSVYVSYVSVYVWL